MSNSNLVSCTKISPHKNSPRNHAIDTITIHCVVGQCSAERIGEIFAQAREVSSNYGIGYDGRIGMYVEEKDRSWCSSSASNDHRAVTIEVASDTTEPYAVTDKAYAALIDLVTDICKRNGIKALLWKGDKSLIGQIDKQNMTVHRWFAAKSCPGTYLYNLHPQIAAEVNARLGAQAEQAEPEEKPQEQPTSEKAVTPRTTAPAANDKYWIKTTKGGLNECIEINTTTGSVLSNCVGYAWGRAYEILGSRPSLSRGNAEDWHGNTGDGYARGSVPKVGAIVCWRKGKAGNQADGAGHVAVIEKVYDNGDVLTSNSNYKGTRFYTMRVTKSSGYTPWSGYTLQGFIYLPVKEQAEKPQTGGAFGIGDEVSFTGSKHYINANAANGKACKSGRAKITAIAAKGKHPYHLVKVTGGGSTVHGWVDAADVAGAEQAQAGAAASDEIKVGSTVRLRKGAKTYTGGSLASFVYNRDHVVKQINGKRVVITYGKTVIAAVNVDDLTLV